MMTPRLAQMTLAAIAATYFEPFRQRDAALGCLAANIDSFLKVFDGDKGHPGTPLQ